MSLSKLVATLCLLMLTATLLMRRGNADRIPKGVPLQNFPQTLGPWAGKDQPLQDYVLDVLGKGVFLNRVYVRERSMNPAGAAADDVSVGLFIGYFPTQRTGQAIHSPQNCLPGAGWTFVTSGVTALPSQGPKPVRVGEYLITNGEMRDVVLYWYRTHGRSLASDYAAKWYTLTDSILMQRTDSALVRVIAPLGKGEDPQAGHQRAVDFAARMNAQLGPYLPD